jgi:hypothetical protein
MPRYGRPSAERRPLMFCAIRGGHVECAHVGDKCRCVVTLVGAQGDATSPDEWRTIFPLSGTAAPVVWVDAPRPRGARRTSDEQVIISCSINFRSTGSYRTPAAEAPAANPQAQSKPDRQSHQNPRRSDRIHHYRNQTQRMLRRYTLLKVNSETLPRPYIRAPAAPANNHDARRERLCERSARIANRPSLRPFERAPGLCRQSKRERFDRDRPVRITTDQLRWSPLMSSASLPLATASVMLASTCRCDYQDSSTADRREGQQ